MQNIYDDPEFFAGYSAIRNRETSLNELLDAPTIRSLLPPLAGSDVVDLGCGMGHMSEYAASQGARSVFGIDLSEKMLAQAIARNPAPEVITYCRLPLEEFRGEAQFDCAVSSLALHYVADYADVAARVARALRSGGRFVFSVEHPVLTSEHRYLDEGPRRYHWIVDNVLGFHRTIGSYVQPLLAAGLVLESLLEPDFPPGTRGSMPEWTPPFLYVRARKP